METTKDAFRKNPDHLSSRISDMEAEVAKYDELAKRNDEIRKSARRGYDVKRQI
jgi:hypothetical protein